eukprot:m.335335 g.335335  ORF g.335335 m.335335 type:complete len:217 (+) comp17572_c0_seq1:121-771(+)
MVNMLKSKSLILVSTLIIFFVCLAKVTNAAIQENLEVADLFGPILEDVDDVKNISTFGPGPHPHSTAKPKPNSSKDKPPTGMFIGLSCLFVGILVGLFVVHRRVAGEERATGFELLPTSDPDRGGVVVPNSSPSKTKRGILTPRGSLSGTPTLSRVDEESEPEYFDDPGNRNYKIQVSNDAVRPIRVGDPMQDVNHIAPQSPTSVLNLSQGVYDDE